MRIFGKRRLLSVMMGLALALGTGVALAREATVTGMGASREAALDDAKRTAVEEVVGTFIDSRSLSEMSIVTLDEIYTKSHGFVKKITVLEEGQTGDTWRVRAKIDVDTNPDASLMDKLTMLMMTNDPRISVVVLKEDMETGERIEGHDSRAESVMNDRLIEMGFSHVVDMEMVTALSDTPLLARVFGGERLTHADGVDRSIEYLVLGKGATDSYGLTLPERMGGGGAGMTTATTKLTVKIMKYDTGDIIGTFTTSGQGVKNTRPLARASAMEAAAKAAAAEVEKKFRTFAAKSATQGIQVKVRAKDQAAFDALCTELRSLTGVEGVHVRSYRAGVGVVELDSSQKPHAIARMLRERGKIAVFVEEVTESSLEVAVS